MELKDYLVDFRYMYPLIANAELTTVPEIPINHCSENIRKIPETVPTTPIMSPVFAAFFLFLSIV